MTALEIPPHPFTWRDAAAWGWSRRDIAHLLDSRQVQRVLHGVYQATGLTPSADLRLQAAGLVLRPGHVISDRLAAWVYGVDSYEWSERLWLPPIETVAPPDGPRQRGRGCVGRRRDLLPTDVQTIAGLPITTPLRTALDLGSGLRSRGALAALDGLMRECGVTQAELLAELPRFEGRRGVVQLRRLVALADPRAESPPESWTRMAMIDAGLPVPDLQIWVDDRFRIDVGYDLPRVGAEYDGVEVHTTPEQKYHDDERRSYLAARGWTIIVIRKEDFGAEAIRRWTEEIRTALRLAA